MLNGIRNGRLSSMDTHDQLGVFAVAVGMLFLTGGIAGFFGQDLTTMWTATVGGVALSLAVYLPVVGTAVIAGTNDFKTEDMLDFKQIEGVAGIICIAAPLVLAYEPQFVVDHVLNNNIGGFVVWAGSVTSATVLATFPYR